MNVHAFHGSHRDVGRAHGEALRAGVRESLELRMALCQGGKRPASPETITAVACECLEHVGAYAPDLIEEVEGMAEGAGVTPEDILVVSGFTDFKDVLVYGLNDASDCTACWVGKDATTDGESFVGQTWDMFAEAESGAAWTHLVVDGEPEMFVLTYGGCVGMMGMNEHGVAVSGTNLNPTDAVAGVPWTFICRRILTCETAEQAASELARARLCSGHHFLIGDASGTGISIETTGRAYARIPITETSYAHTNHYLDPGLAKVEREADPKGCSPHRRERMDAILREGRGEIDSAFIQNAFRDHDGKPRSICSHGYVTSSGMKISSCGALVMNTTKSEVDYVTGNPCKREFSRFRF